jgi:hypothetical protein
MCGQERRRRGEGPGRGREGGELREGVLTNYQTVVNCHTFLVQRLERYWPEASKFKPERFVIEDVPISMFLHFK